MTYFDTVNHKILLKKLEYYGIRGLANKWFTSYLTNREHFVSINGYDSDPLPMKHGVPQGSVLGPLLFLIYINDLNVAIQNSFVFHFADDTNLLNIEISPKKMQRKINYDLKTLYQWLLANKITLNSTKTELIFFHKPGKSIKDFTFNIKINGHKLFETKNVKYLGVHVESELSGDFHSN